MILECVDTGGNGDCGFLSLLTALTHDLKLYKEEVKLLRNLLGKFYDKDISLPEEGKGTEAYELQESFKEKDIYLPDEDVSGEGVFMQDRDINALVHILDLDEVIVVVGDHEQKFTQYKEFGEKVRKVMKNDLIFFYSQCPILVGKKQAKLKHIPEEVHFKAYINKENIPYQEEERKRPLSPSSFVQKEKEEYDDYEREYIEKYRPYSPPPPLDSSMWPPPSSKLKIKNLP
jgi:hypothetical protein